VFQGKLAGMEHLAFYPDETSPYKGLLHGSGALLAAIGGIPHHWMLDVGQVHPNLMRSPGLDYRFDQRDLAKAHLNVPGGKGLTTADCYSHLLAVSGVSVHGFGDLPAGRWQAAENQNTVFLVNPALFELQTEVTVGEVVLRGNQYSTGILVETVNDTRSQRPTELRQAVAMVQETVHQRALSVTSGRVDHHSGWFVDRNQNLVFVEDVQVDSFGNEFGGRLRWQKELNAFPGTQPMARLVPLAVDQYATSLDQPLNLIAGKPL
jgi:hypothetical protein